jgi:hypothetical protein
VVPGAPSKGDRGTQNRLLDPRGVGRVNSTYTEYYSKRMEFQG